MRSGMGTRLRAAADDDRPCPDSFNYDAGARDPRPVRVPRPAVHTERPSVEGPLQTIGAGPDVGRPPTVAAHAHLHGGLLAHRPGAQRGRSLRAVRIFSVASMDILFYFAVIGHEQFGCSYQPGHEGVFPARNPASHVCHRRPYRLPGGVPGYSVRCWCTTTCP